MSFQTQGLEFLVTDRLGGTERNPSFSIDPRDEAYVRPTAENFYSFTVAELGVVDLSFLPRSPSVGVRFVPHVWINSPVVPSLGVGAVEVVDAVTLTRMRTAFFAPGFATYFKMGVIVPQGGALRFNDNWIIPPGSPPLRIFIEAYAAQNTLHWAAMHQAFCCLGAPPVVPEGEPGPPPPG